MLLSRNSVVITIMDTQQLWLVICTRSIRAEKDMKAGQIFLGRRMGSIEGRGDVMGANMIRIHCVYVENCQN